MVARHARRELPGTEQRGAASAAAEPGGRLTGEPPAGAANVRRADLVAAATLLGIFVLFLARSWLAWGDLDYDYGREMYLPLRLARGDVIYRDVRYPYG